MNRHMYSAVNPQGLPTRGGHMVKRFLTAVAPLAMLICTAMAPSGTGTAAPTYAAAYATYASAIPAFARKYGLRCSACHTAWPELNAFGQRFKDNGYQLGNDRDSPIWVNPSYIPFGVRTTPQWRLERTTHQPVDAIPGDPTSGTVERTITQSGFDISGADLL